MLCVDRQVPGTLRRSHYLVRLCCFPPLFPLLRLFRWLIGVVPLIFIFLAGIHTLPSVSVFVRPQRQPTYFPCNEEEGGSEHNRAFRRCTCCLRGATARQKGIMRREWETKVENEEKKRDTNGKEERERSIVLSR
ncbi:T. brucei spp.-specific protein [Trypanosoma brucei gambiense DAL972]|uniref:T. brucei spp.-specific protein n=1 Tax=Trypanosoma brucei gambiense (strain MHOM/CI/86/DAL972) TaxID=679716 RepID=C9ZMJ0_TRYB9|nr:T. brucei spp.-specific protein [Trypanosoma brucei gambiense DAL972]CBH10492.1 T. brucei spp.-specific protein [Trypanosoma brucei gambiense DAL972]|eukprot:XP_011772782.1 T. brucei spp.-specific protein [Trypanosoma brucei gambiense DAL972]